MGNFEQNQLRQCQVNDIAQLLRQMEEAKPLDYKPGSASFFWIDTLCIPVKGNENRRCALLLLKEVNQKATNVLIIDSSLRQKSPENDTEAALLVIISPWASCLWTMEEVILSRRPYVRFANSTMNLRTFQKSLHSLRRGLSGGIWEGEWTKAVSGLWSRLFTW